MAKVIYFCHQKSFCIKNNRICHKDASERLIFNNTVQAKRSAVIDNQLFACVSERYDLAYVPIADNLFCIISCCGSRMVFDCWYKK